MVMSCYECWILAVLDDGSAYNLGEHRHYMYTRGVAAGSQLDDVVRPIDADSDAAAPSIETPF